MADGSNGESFLPFVLIEDRAEALDAIAAPRLRRLLDYWSGACAGRAMPARADIDPLGLREHMGRIHMLEVLGPGRFRFRIYGSGMTNPDVRDMTGLTTDDYEDKAFGALVTRHYKSCVEAKAPVYHCVLGELDALPYEYARLTLPLSSDGTSVDMLLASAHRIRVSKPLPVFRS